MVLNDEAHHLWDSGSAWNEAIAYLHAALSGRTNNGIAAQLDFSATPKDNHGRIFQHVVCDAPLGEAVDGGIVKTPIIGRGEGLVERTSQDASEKYQQHLLIGYERWRRSREEWRASGKKPLLFVMSEDTEAADQIARRMNTDPLFAELNGRTVNLHTRLKGKVRHIGRGANARVEFVESEGDISDEDLKELRKLSRELDSGASPYQCIVSVLMLREGWDVRNVTTIVPLRPYTSKANILPEQTLGRGLRRMTYTDRCRWGKRGRRRSLTRGGICSPTKLLNRSQRVHRPPGAGIERSDGRPAGAGQMGQRASHDLELAPRVMVLNASIVGWVWVKVRGCDDGPEMVAEAGADDAPGLRERPPADAGGGPGRAGAVEERGLAHQLRVGDRDAGDRAGDGLAGDVQHAEVPEVRGAGGLRPDPGVPAARAEIRDPRAGLPEHALVLV